MIMPLKKELVEKICTCRGNRSPANIHQLMHTMNMRGQHGMSTLYMERISRFAGQGHTGAATVCKKL